MVRTAGFSQFNYSYFSILMRRGPREDQARIKRGPGEGQEGARRRPRPIECQERARRGPGEGQERAKREPGRVKPNKATRLTMRWHFAGMLSGKRAPVGE